MPASTRFDSVTISQSARMTAQPAARNTSDAINWRLLRWRIHWPKRPAERIKQRKNSGQVAEPIDAPSAGKHTHRETLGQRAGVPKDAVFFAEPNFVAVFGPGRVISTVGR